MWCSEDEKWCLPICSSDLWTKAPFAKYLVLVVCGNNKVWMCKTCSIPLFLYSHLLSVCCGCSCQSKSYSPVKRALFQCSVWWIETFLQNSMDPLWQSDLNRIGFVKDVIVLSCCQLWLFLPYPPLPPLLISPCRLRLCLCGMLLLVWCGGDPQRMVSIIGLVNAAVVECNGDALTRVDRNFYSGPNALGEKEGGGDGCG